MSAPGPGAACTCRLDHIGRDGVDPLDEQRVRGYHKRDCPRGDDWVATPGDHHESGAAILAREVRQAERDARRERHPQHERRHHRN